MRTRAELEIEARRLEQRLHEAQHELNNNAGSPVAVSGIAAKPLFTFPESTVAIVAGSETGRPETHRMVRHVTMVNAPAGLSYRLIEEEFVSDSNGQLVRHYDPIEISTDGGAFGILSAGFQRLDEDRLWERLEPVVPLIEAKGWFTDSERASAVGEVEKYTSELNLSASARMRVKSDTIDLLEGRLEMGDFVARTVARQECFAVLQRAVQSHQHTESIEV
jgi:hypothetical protein